VDVDVVVNVVVTGFYWVAALPRCVNRGLSFHIRLCRWKTSAGSSPRGSLFFWNLKTEA
jgi:hypothetical protein